MSKQVIFLTCRVVKVTAAAAEREEAARRALLAKLAASRAHLAGSHRPSERHHFDATRAGLA